MSERTGNRVVVVMPARNAARTLADTVAAIPTDWVDEVILVDDKSTDETVALARDLPVHLVWHPHNVGYGGNQKTCYLQALQRDADIVVMLHPDGQYEPEPDTEMLGPILRGEADFVLGSRFAEPGMARGGGMPLWKYVANRSLTTIENASSAPTSPRCTRATAPTRASCCSRCRSCATPSTSRSTPR